MKILVVSDSHGFEGNLRKVIERVEPVDMLIHLGDFESGEDRIKNMVNCDIHMVPGNNDYAPHLEKDKVINISGHRLFLTHGHKYGVYYGLYGLYDKAKENNCDVVLYGHTHIPKINYMDDIAFVNPGSISLPRQNYTQPTFLIMEIDKKNEIHFTLNDY